MRRLPLLPWLRHGLVPNWVLLLLTFACFAPGLSGPLVLDDDPQLGPLLQAFSHGRPDWHALPPLLHSEAGPGGRPVAMASFVASLWLHGGKAFGGLFDNLTFGLKFDNLLLHLACGVILLAWLRALRRLEHARVSHAGGARGPSGDGWAVRLAPWGVTAVWLLHPMQVSTVLYTVQRMTELSTLFMLLGLLAYTEGRRLLAQQRPLGGRVLLAVTGLVCLPLALFSKENGILLLPLCACLELTVLRGFGDGRTRRLVAGFYALVLMVPGVLALTVLRAPLLAWLQPGYAFRDFTLAQRLLTEGRAIGYYVLAWCWPAPSLLGFFHDGLRPSLDWLHPQTTLMGILLVALLVWLAFALRRRAPLAALGLLVFLVGHLLESTALPLELLFEHRNYFPSVGLTLFCAALPWRGLLPPRLWLYSGPFARSAANRRTPRLLRWTPSRLLLIGLLVALAGLCANRAFLWGSAERLYPSLLAAEPTSPRLAAVFANSYANAGHFSDAQGFLAGQHSLGAALQRLDIDCLARASFDDGRLAPASTLQPRYLSPYEVQQLVHLANDALEQRCGLPIPWTSDLLDRLSQLPVQKSADRALLGIYRAHLHHAQQQLPQALAALAAAQQASSASPLPRLLAATWLLDAHDAVQAGPLVKAVCAGAVPVSDDWKDTCGELAQRLQEVHHLQEPHHAQDPQEKHPDNQPAEIRRAGSLPLKGLPP